MGPAGGDDAFQRGHDLSHAGLVVRAQQGGTVGGDERFALEAIQAGKACRREHRARGGEHDVAAVIVRVQLRLDPLAGIIGRSVHMSD